MNNTFRKIISILIILTVSASLCACNEQHENTENNSSAVSSSALESEAGEQSDILSETEISSNSQITSDTAPSSSLTSEASKKTDHSSDSEKNDNSRASSSVSVNSDNPKKVTVSYETNNQNESHASSAITPSSASDNSGKTELSSVSGSYDNSDVLSDWKDNGIFSPYYRKAYQKMKKMTTEEKVGQIILARCPDDDNYFQTAKNYHLGGYVLFYSNFKDKNRDDVIRFTRTLVESQDVPMIIASDMEGGTVNRLDGLTDITDEEFLSPRELFDQGGMEAIKKDAVKKSLLLNDLGINTNLAPVCDICTGETRFMYERSLGQSASVTSAFVENVTHISQSNGVSVTLKHFPGYGNNEDTHTGIAVDKRTYESFENTDFLPFKAGIENGAHVVMVSHNIVECMDGSRPASLSEKVHEILRNDLKFSGIIISDDLEMGAIKQYSGNYPAAVTAFLAGNDMLCVSRIQETYNDVLSAVKSGTIPKNMLDHSVMRVLAWKYAKGLITE